MRERPKGPPPVGYHVVNKDIEPPREPVNQAGIGGSHKPTQVIRLEVSTTKETATPKDGAEEVLTVRQWLHKQVLRLRSRR